MSLGRYLANTSDLGSHFMEILLYMHLSNGEVELQALEALNR